MKVGIWFDSHCTLSISGFYDRECGRKRFTRGPSSWIYYSGDIEARFSRVDSGRGGCYTVSLPGQSRPRVERFPGGRVVG